MELQYIETFQGYIIYRDYSKQGCDEKRIVIKHPTKSIEWFCKSIPAAKKIIKANPFYSKKILDMN